MVRSWLMEGIQLTVLMVNKCHAISARSLEDDGNAEMSNGELLYGSDESNVDDDDWRYAYTAIWTTSLTLIHGPTIDVWIQFEIVD